jgi:type IV pilus assembly protein PilA
MICPQCGTSVAEGTTFCPMCGRALAQVPASPVMGAVIPAGGEVIAAPPATSGKAIASLVLGIVPLSIFSSIPAVVLGHLALSDIKKSTGQLQGKGLAIAGLVLGYLGIAAVPIILIIAAVAVPNLLRARTAANEAAAVASLRSINAAQFGYRSAFKKGFAQDLASLGPDSSTSCAGPTLERACLLDYRLSLASARPGSAGYLFEVHSFSEGDTYVATAVPEVRNQTGHRSFCSFEDGVIRVNGSGGAIPDRAACGALPPLNRVESE